MAGVLVASMPWGVLYERNASSRVLSVPDVGVEAEIDTDVFSDQALTIPLAVPFVSDSYGRLPGYVDEGDWTLTIDGVEYPAAVLGGTLPARVDAAEEASEAVDAALVLLAPKASPTFTGTVSGVSKTHVGLGNVDNTSDADKPVSTAADTRFLAVESDQADLAADVVTRAPLNTLGRFTVMPEVLSLTAAAVRGRSAVDGLTHKWDVVQDAISGNFGHFTTGPNTLPSRTVTDGVTTNGSPTITSATAAFYSGNDRPDQGKRITGTGIPANAAIGTVTNATTAQLVDYTTGLPVNATASGTGITFTIGAGNPNGAVFAIGVTGGTGILINNYATGSGLSLVQLPLAAATAHVLNLQNQSAGAAAKAMYVNGGTAPAGPLIQFLGAAAAAATPMVEWRDQNASPICGQIMADTGLLHWRRTIQTVAPNSSVTPLIRVADEAAAATETYLSAKTTVDHGLVMYRWSGSGVLMYGSKITTTSDRLKIMVGNGAQAKGSETWATAMEVRCLAAPQIGFYGVTPVSRAAAITSPAADAAALKTAVDAIRVALTNVGITS